MNIVSDGFSAMEMSSSSPPWMRMSSVLVPGMLTTASPTNSRPKL